MTTLQTKLKIATWDETTAQELPDGQKLTRVNVPLAVSEDRIEATASLTAVMHYTADGQSSFVGLMCVEGTLDGRSGSFVLRGIGTYDGTYARSELSVIPGTGTGELASIRGSGSSESTHEDVPFMPLTLDYELD